MGKVEPEVETEELVTTKEVGEGDAVFNIVEPQKEKLPRYLAQGADYEVRTDGSLWRKGVPNPDGGTGRDAWLKPPSKIANRAFWMARTWGLAEEKDGTLKNKFESFYYVDRSGVIRPAQIDTGDSTDIVKFVKEMSKYGLRVSLNNDPRVLREYIEATFLYVLSRVYILLSRKNPLASVLQLC